VTTTTTTTVVGQKPPPTTTTTTTTLPPTQIALNADPNPIDYGQVAVGIGSPIKTVTITNIGDGPGQLLTELGGDNPGDFYVARNGCDAVTLAPNESCSMDIMMIPLAGGIRKAELILTTNGLTGSIDLFGDGHFAPQLVASPSAITQSGITALIGRGFPPNQSFSVRIVDNNQVPAINQTLPAVTSDASGMFQIMLMPLGSLGLGNYVLEVDPVPDVFDLVQGQLTVVLPTFQPLGPGGPAFNNSLLVTRGGG
jgi:hypothetical protein